MRRSTASLVAGLALLASGCSGSEAGASNAGPRDASVWQDASPDGSSCGNVTCASVGAECGSAPDGCGSTIQCGDCPSGQFCGGGGPNLCGTAPCTKKSCADQQAECGVVSDGCEGTMTCGECVAPYECEGAGVKNHCGIPCQKATCAQLGAQCGTPSDECGGNLDCGPCVPPETCGGGGVPYHCGSSCVPKTCEQLGAECGTASDGCNATLSCGTCPAGVPCSGSKCQCGAEGQVCCPTNPCKAGLICEGTDAAAACIRCGGPGEIACGAGTCGGGLTATWLPEFGVNWCFNLGASGLPGGTCSSNPDGGIGTCSQPSVSACIGLSVGQVCAACGNFHQVCCPAQSPAGSCNMGSCQPYNGYVYVCK